MLVDNFLNSPEWVRQNLGTANLRAGMGEDSSRKGVDPKKFMRAHAIVEPTPAIPKTCIPIGSVGAWRRRTRTSPVQ